MGKLNRGIVAVAILAAFGGMGDAAFARYGEGKDVPPGQMGRGGKQGRLSVEERLARMTARLDLTVDQQARIRPILEEREKQLVSLRDDPTISRDQKRGNFRQIGKESFEKINAVLTPGQREKHELMRERARERWDKRCMQLPKEAPAVEKQ